MTETLSHIALRPIAEDYYSPLPGITLEHDANDCLIIHAPTLCTDTLITNDIVRFIGDNKFQIIGRRDNTVCSGGIKIQIEEVEHWLHSLGIDNVVVTYRTDARLGQALVYLCTDSLDIDSLTPPTHISTARYWLPRHIVCVPQLPLTANGKPDRALAHKIAENYL
jgi:O-succinylbenzoic acid--CoA ligase